VLFVLMGLEVIVIHFPSGIAAAAVLAISVTLLTRWLTVGLPVDMRHLRLRLPIGSGRVLTWGGLRGGISVALALSLPAGLHRETPLGPHLLCRRVLDPGAGPADRRRGAPGGENLMPCRRLNESVPAASEFRETEDRCAREPCSCSCSAA